MSILMRLLGLLGLLELLELLKLLKLLQLLKLLKLQQLCVLHRKIASFKWIYSCNFKTFRRGTLPRHKQLLRCHQRLQSAAARACASDDDEIAWLAASGLTPKNVRNMAEKVFEKAVSWCLQGAPGTQSLRVSVSDFHFSTVKLGGPNVTTGRRLFVIFPL